MLGGAYGSLSGTNDGTLTITGVGTIVIAANQAASSNYSAATQTTQSVVVNQAAQTIAFPQPATPVTYSNGLTATLTETSTSGLAVTYKIVSGPASVTGSTVTLTYTGPGSVVVEADQAGNATYAAAAPVQRTIAVNAAPAIAFTIPNHTYSDAPFTVSATSNSTGAFTYSLVSGNATVTAAGLVTLTGTGPVMVLASEAAHANYVAATKQASFTVAIAQLTVSVNNSSRVYGASNPVFIGAVTGMKYTDSFTESFATTATAAFPVGAYPVVPSVTGTNLGDYSVTTVDGTLTIAQAPSTTALSVSSTSINPNQTVTLTAQVSSTTTGTLTGLDNGTPLQTVQLASGSASYATLLSPGTTHVLTASYMGDPNFLASLASASSGVPITVVVAPLDFTFSFTGQNLTVAPGKTAVYSFSIDPLYGSYAGSVTFRVTGLPPGATAGFTPSSVAANSGPQTVTLSVQTAASMASREQGLRD